MSTTHDFTGGQFPSLDGNVAGEVAQRQPGGGEPGWFHRIFTVHNRAHTPGLPADHWWHGQNAVAVLGDAIQRGLHPKGEVELVGESPHPTDRNTTNVEYRVPVVPAIVDHEPETTQTPGALAAVLAGPDDEVEVRPQYVDTATEWPVVPAVAAAVL
jgi:hypothetical protein